MLKVFLIGYGELAYSLLNGIINSGHKPVGCLHWEKSQSNPILHSIKNLFAPDRFSLLCKAHNIPSFNVKSVNSNEFKQIILQLNPDIILVGSWGEKLKKDIIMLPRIACVNCHPSLLPRYRGPNPYSAVIKEGEEKTGVTFHLMNEKFDAGEILLQKEVGISEEDTGESLRIKCAYTASQSLEELFNGLRVGSIIPQKQNEQDAFYYTGLNEDDAIINWDSPSGKIYNQIRGQIPWVYCYFRHGDEFIKIKSAKFIKIKNVFNKPARVLEVNSKEIIISTLDEEKAILVDDFELYSYFGAFYAQYYVKNKINIGDKIV